MNQSRFHFVFAIGFVLFAMCSPSVTQGQDFREATERGVKAFESENFAEAKDAFLQAIGSTNNADVALGNFNLATSDSRMGNFEEAMTRFQEFPGSESLDLQQSMHFNQANTAFAQAAALEAQSDLEGATKAMSTAVSHYRDSLRLNPKNTQAVKNLELAGQNLRRLKNIPSQQQEEGEDGEEGEEGDESEDSEEGDESEDSEEGDESEDSEEGDESDDSEDSEPSEDGEGEDEGEKSDEESSDPSEEDSSEDGEESGDESEGDNPEGEEGEQSPPPEPSGEPQEMTMSQEDVNRILQSLLMDEQENRPKLKIRAASPMKIEKDW